MKDIEEAKEKYAKEVKERRGGCAAYAESRDERFRNNLNQFGEGTAEYMAAAIKNYCKG